MVFHYHFVLELFGNQRQKRGKEENFKIYFHLHIPCKYLFYCSTHVGSFPSHVTREKHFLPSFFMLVSREWKSFMRFCTATLKASTDTMSQTI
jgi:hypothetical protein